MIKISKYNLGDINFWISPVSIMKCFVGIGWHARGIQEAVEEYKRFSDELFRFMFTKDNEMSIDDFCGESIAKIDEIIQTQKPAHIDRFSQRIRNTLDDAHNKRNAQEYASKYSGWMNEVFASPYGIVMVAAAEKFKEEGVYPVEDSLGAVGSFGNAVYGKHVNSLNAVCIQMDVVTNSKHPEIEFLDTLLHEEVHYAINQIMGEDKKRNELSWLNELAAVLTSQYAIRSAGSNNESVEEALKDILKTQKYGELAEAVLADTNNPLIAWQAWRKISELPEDEKQAYSRKPIIKPILTKLGWDVKFPYTFGNKRVTVFV